MPNNHSLLALDVGEKRIGIATADSSIKIAVARETIDVDGVEIDKISQLARQEDADTVIIGYPRNQSGEATQQTAYVEAFAKRLSQFVPHLVFQDESLTSVRAEEILKARKKPYKKADIDAIAASLILQDYLENTYGRI